MSDRMYAAEPEVWAHIDALEKDLEETKARLSIAEALRADADRWAGKCGHRRDHALVALGAVGIRYEGAKKEIQLQRERVAGAEQVIRREQERNRDLEAEIARLEALRDYHVGRIREIEADGMRSVA